MVAFCRLSCTVRLLLPPCQACLPQYIVHRFLISVDCPQELMPLLRPSSFLPRLARRPASLPRPARYVLPSTRAGKIRNRTGRGNGRPGDLAAQEGWLGLVSGEEAWPAGPTRQTPATPRCMLHSLDCCAQQYTNSSRSGLPCHLPGRMVSNCPPLRVRKVGEPAETID